MYNAQVNPVMQELALPRVVKESSGLYRTYIHIGYTRTCDHPANRLNCMVVEGSLSNVWR